MYLSRLQLGALILSTFPLGSLSGRVRYLSCAREVMEDAGRLLTTSCYLTTDITVDTPTLRSCEPASFLGPAALLLVSADAICCLDTIPHSLYLLQISPSLWYYQGVPPCELACSAARRSLLS